MRKRVLIVLGAAVLTLAMVAPLTANARPASRLSKSNAEALAFYHQFGYLPIHGVKVLRDAKAYAARWAMEHAPAANRPSVGAAGPTVGQSWNGSTDTVGTPYDATGAVGPNSYLEAINTKLTIYTRTGTQKASAEFSSLLGGGSYSDPMVIWDPHTQRFYYSILNVGTAQMGWGFSKTDNPASLPGDFCSYQTNFGYPAGSIPDYPKLGQTKNFLMIGDNYYPPGVFNHATQSDLLWLSKPQGKDPITTCPAASSFKSGRFQDLRNEDGTQAFTPVPAIQTDPSKFGFVVTMTDIECPDICGNGTQITVHGLRPSKSDPTVPQLLTVGNSITVPTYTSPPAAPMKGTTHLLDSLDGRLMHAVAGIDPNVGEITVWLNHTVMGGAGAETRWYEILPTPVSAPTLVQNGKASSASLYVINGGVSNDRTISAAGKAHGGAMVMGFTTSSSTTFPAIQMVSKVGSNAQSAFVLVKQSTSFENDFSCSPTCRWGDYSGATPDPAAAIGNANGEVWLTNEWADGGSIMRSWNWEALP
jgi:hypothetical protein